MWTLSGFADEISPELSEQLEVLAAEKIKYMELRGVWNINVVKFTDEQLKSIKEALDAAGVKVSSIGSPIGKIKITDPMAPHLDDMQRAIHAAQYLGSPYIRIFSFFLPEGENPAKYRGEVMDRLFQVVKAAEGTGVTLLHENEKHIYGDIPERCHDILTTIGSPSLRAVWDPANFVQVGVRPFTEGFKLLRPYIEYVHVKDAVLETGGVVPAGEGDGEIRQLVAALKADGFDGFFSIEPHLASAGVFSGFSGPQLWRTASQAFKAILAENGVTWA